MKNSSFLKVYYEKCDFILTANINHNAFVTEDDGIQERDKI